MQDTTMRWRVVGASLITAVLAAGCAAPRKPAPAQPPEPPACKAPAAHDNVTGNWLSIHRQKGVRGELRTLYTLNPDGTLAYTEQLKRSGKPSQGLSETGCWSRAGSTLELRTLESNGAPVNQKDPIYTNRYTVMSASGDRLVLRSEDGTEINARRMSPGYRLPF